MTAQESGRRKLVALITFIYLLLIFEGALRKWAFPSLSQALFFIRDPFVLIAYWLALRHGFFPRNNPFLLAGIGLGLLAIPLVATQTLASPAQAKGALLLAAYGWRNYFLYIPLAFVIAECFQKQDLQRLIKITLVLAVPSAILMFLQFVSPLTSPLNVGFGEEGAQFRGLTVDEFHVRPAGFFTSDLGQREFTASAVAMVLSLWLIPAAHRAVKFWPLLIGTGAVLACLAIGGSRGAVLQSGIVVLTAMACAVLVRGGGISARAVVWPCAIGLIAVFLYPVLFPEQYEAFIFRWTMAAAAETQHFQFGIFGRALYGFIDFFYLVEDAPLMGYGLGLAGNARLILGIEIPGFDGWAENDWARHIVDLGPFMGILFILYRVALVVWLGLACLRGARRTRNPMALLLFAYMSVELLYGQISGHGSVNGYAWMFAGFALAAAQLRSTGQQVAAPEPAAQRRFANLMR